MEKVYCFRLEDGKWLKVYETEDSEKLAKYDLPYHAAGLSIILPDGSEKVVSGVVDEEFVHSYSEVI